MLETAGPCVAGCGLRVKAVNLGYTALPPRWGGAECNCAQTDVLQVAGAADKALPGGEGCITRHKGQRVVVHWWCSSMADWIGEGLVNEGPDINEGGRTPEGSLPRSAYSAQFAHGWS